MKKNVSVSVVIPTYNMGWCIERAIKSCLNQSTKPQEIIVVDDGSSDNSKKLVEKLAKQNKIISYHKLRSNQGAALAMMYGVNKATSDWVAFLDADDELTKDSLSSRIQVVNNYPRVENLSFVYGNVFVKKPEGLKLIKNKLISGYQYPYIVKELSLCQQIVILVNRKILLESGYPTIKLASSTDDDMILSLAKRHEIAYTQEPVAIIHLHNSASRMTNNLDGVAEGTALLVEKYQRDMIKYHGHVRLLLWRIRIFRRKIEAKIVKSNNIVEKTLLKLIYHPLQYIVLKTFNIHWL